MRNIGSCMILSLVAFLVAFNLGVRPGWGDAVPVTRGSTITVNNSTGKPCPVGIIITGRQQFADSQGIEWQGHHYYFFESDTSLLNLKGVDFLQASGASPDPASSDTMMVFQPTGTAVLPLDVPAASTYYFHVRMLRHGNSQPTLALSVGGRDIGKARGIGWCFAGQIDLAAGHHEIVLTESGSDDPTVPSARLAALDCISVSTNPKIPLWHQVTTSASNPEDVFWLNRVGIPTRNPLLTLGPQQAGVTASLDDGQLAIFYSDGTITGSDLRKDPLFEDEKGLMIGPHLYLFYDLSDGGKAIAGSSSQGQGLPDWGIGGLNKNDFVELRPGGIWEYELEVPRAGNYRIAVRVGQHGNSGPSFKFFLDGREVGEYHGGGGAYNWLALTTVRLEAGRHTLRFQESGQAPGDAVNMVGLDCLELTTDPEGKLYNELGINPSDPTDQYWLTRMSRPADDQVEALRGGPLMLNPGENRVTYSCASISSPEALVEIIPRKTVPLTVSPAKITPNDDGYQDITVISTPPDAPQGVMIHAELTDVLGRIVCRLPEPQVRAGGGYEFRWDGNDPEGKPVPDASYVARVYMGDDLVALGLVRTEAKTPKICSARPERFSPNGDGVNDTTAISYRFFEETTATLRVLNASDKVVRQWPAKKYSAGSYNELWDGKDDGGNVIPDGDYLVQAVDEDSVEQWHIRVRTRTDRTWPESKAPVDFFPIGVWMGGGGQQPLEDVLKRLSGDGFNAISGGGGALCGKYGLRFIAGGPLALDEFDVADAVEKDPSFRDPALLAYYIADEPGFDRADELFVTRRVIEALDPGRVAIACLIGEWVPMAKQMQPRVHYIDVYPILPNAAPGDFHRMYYTQREMVEYIDWARSQVSPDVPLWIILQCHEFEGWLRLPSPEEIRCQTYLSIAHGAKGIFYFTYYGVSWPGMVNFDGTPTPRYTVAAQLAKELRLLAPTLMKLRVADQNIATVEGGGNSAYKAGDVTTLVDAKTGEQYIAVTNRNCEATSQMTIYIDPTGIKGGAKKLVTVPSEDAIPLVLREGMLVGAIELAPGDGRLLRLAL